MNYCITIYYDDVVGIVASHAAVLPAGAGYPNPFNPVTTIKYSIANQSLHDSIRPTEQRK
jgi:hypothetical protein